MFHQENKLQHILSSALIDLNPDGIYRARTIEEVSYPSESSAAYMKIEDASFWFKHRNACIAEAVKSLPPPGPIFDIGGGNGFVSLGLMKAGFDVALVEPCPDGAMNAKMRGVPTVIQGTASSCGFAARSLHAVGLFDVLEHVEDDVGFLASIRRLMTAEGKLYLTVPAYNALWSEEDELTGHFRRYTCASLLETLQCAGFRKEYATYIFRPLPLPIFLIRALPYLLGRRRSTPKLDEHTSVLDRAISWILRTEIKNVRQRNVMRFGGSCLVVASAR